MTKNARRGRPVNPPPQPVAFGLRMERNEWLNGTPQRTTAPLVILSVAGNLQLVGFDGHHCRSPPLSRSRVALIPTGSHEGEASFGLGEEMGDCRRVGTRQRSQPCPSDRRRTAAGQLVGTSQGQADIPALASDSPLARRSGVPPGGWENYLRPSTDVARPGFDGRTIFQAAACSLEGSSHALRQAQGAGNSISRLGAERSPANRAAAHREKGRFTVVAPAEINDGLVAERQILRDAVAVGW